MKHPKNVVLDYDQPYPSTTTDRSRGVRQTKTSEFKFSYIELPFLFKYYQELQAR